MPQMAPISWLTLFILFSIIFVLFNTMNYYCLVMVPGVNESTTPISHLASHSLNWKW